MLAAETLWDLVERRARATPGAPMLWDERGRRLCYAQYEAAANAAAAGFCRLGVEPGTTVAYQLPTRIETVVLMGALARLGAIQVPLVPIYRETEVA
ncbi:MAG: AMP-binding protein, partial [Proteobacteria bacterium]|nr:AMP-binding protein [Pseudomonadota bacterium]